MDDVSKLDSGKGSSFSDIPDPEVKHERTLSFDGGFKFDFWRLRGNLIGYYNDVTDLLQRRPAELNGSAFVVEAGGTLAVFRKENLSKGRNA